AARPGAGAPTLEAVLSVQFPKETPQAGDEPVRAVERERHGQCPPDDPPALDRPDVAAVFAVVPVVAHDEVEALGHDSWLDPALGREAGSEHHLVRPPVEGLLADDRGSLLGILGLADPLPRRRLAVDV